MTTVAQAGIDLMQASAEAGDAEAFKLQQKLAELEAACRDKLRGKNSKLSGEAFEAAVEKELALDDAYQGLKKEFESMDDLAAGVAVAKSALQPMLSRPADITSTEKKRIQNALFGSGGLMAVANKAMDIASDIELTAAEIALLLSQEGGESQLTHIVEKHLVNQRNFIRIYEDGLVYQQKELVVAKEKTVEAMAAYKAYAEGKSKESLKGDAEHQRLRDGISYSFHRGEAFFFNASSSSSRSKSSGEAN